MGFQCHQKRTAFNVRDAEFSSCLFYDNAYFGIMNIANAGKQVVFNLPVQPAKKKGGSPAACRKIGSSVHLVLCPGFFHVSLSVGRWVICSLYDVRKLENKPHCKPLRKMHCQKAYGQLPPANVEYPQRQGNEQEIIHQFVKEQVKILNLGVLRSMLANLRLEKFLVTFPEDPR